MNEMCFERGAATPSRASTLRMSVWFRVFLAEKFLPHLFYFFIFFFLPQLLKLWLACGDRAGIDWVNVRLGVDARVREGRVDFSFIRFVNPQPTSRGANSLIEIASLVSHFRALAESIYDLILNCLFRGT